MTGQDLKAARMASLWTQNDAAEKLGVTQAYLSMLERGTRAVSSEVAEKAVQVFNIPATALPLGAYQTRRRDESYFQRALGGLGYPGFAYMQRSKKLNPAEVFMAALDSDNLDARVTEALPWLPVAFPKMDLAWLTFNAKVHDRQNRLAFVTVLAAQIASERSDQDLENNLLNLKSEVETEGILDWTDGSARESAIRWAESVTARDRAGPDTVWWNGRVSGVSEQDRISAEGDGMHADCASIAQFDSAGANVHCFFDHGGRWQNCCQSTGSRCTRIQCTGWKRSLIQCVSKGHVTGPRTGLRWAPTQGAVTTHPPISARSP